MTPPLSFPSACLSKPHISISANKMHFAFSRRVWLIFPEFSLPEFTDKQNSMTKMIGPPEKYNIHFPPLSLSLSVGKDKP